MNGDSNLGNIDINQDEFRGYSINIEFLPLTNSVKVNVGGKRINNVITNEIEEYIRIIYPEIKCTQNPENVEFVASMKYGMEYIKEIVNVIVNFYEQNGYAPVEDWKKDNSEEVEVVNYDYVINDMDRQNYSYVVSDMDKQNDLYAVSDMNKQDFSYEINFNNVIPNIGIKVKNNKKKEKKKDKSSEIVVSDIVIVQRIMLCIIILSLLVIALTAFKEEFIYTSKSYKTEKQNIEMLMTEGIKTSAVVTECNLRAERRYRIYENVYVYIDANGNSIEIRNHLFGKEKRHTVGDQAPIYYDKDKPTNVYIPEIKSANKSRYTLNNIIILALSLIILLFLTYCIYLIRNKRSLTEVVNLFIEMVLNRVPISMTNCVICCSLAPICVLAAISLIMTIIAYK